MVIPHVRVFLGLVAGLVLVDGFVVAQRPGGRGAGSRPANVSAANQTTWTNARMQRRGMQQQHFQQQVMGAMPNANQGFAEQQMGAQANGAPNLGNMNNGDVDAMAQMMLVNFDTDGNGALNLVELAAAMQGLRQMMMQRGNANFQDRQAQNDQQANFPVQAHPNQGQFQRGGDARLRRFGRP